MTTHTSQPVGAHRATPSERESVTAVRRASSADRNALLRLAQLDNAAALRGEIVLVEVDGEVCAARSLSDGRAISDPFRPTAMLLELLECHARHAIADRARVRTTHRLSPQFAGNLRRLGGI